MKKIFTSLTGFFIFSIVMLSCRKEAHEQQDRTVEKGQVVTATVPAGQTYVFNMGLGSAVSIGKQAAHHQLSEVGTAEGGNIVYRYAAAKGYTGPDEVTLLQSTTTTTHGGGCSGGDGEHTTTTLNTIVIKLDVSN